MVHRLAAAEIGSAREGGFDHGCNNLTGKGARRGLLPQRPESERRLCAPSAMEKKLDPALNGSVHVKVYYQVNDRAHIERLASVRMAACHRATKAGIRHIFTRTKKPHAIDTRVNKYIIQLRCMFNP